MKCNHEFVSTEYSSQPIGHCHGCDNTVFKNDDDEWVTFNQK